MTIKLTEPAVGERGNGERAVHANEIYDGRNSAGWEMMKILSTRKSYLSPKVRLVKKISLLRMRNLVCLRVQRERQQERTVELQIVFE